MELRDIEYFAVVAEHGQLGRAAESLGLSQPALSKSLRRLEQSVQVKLVKRTPKGIELTAAGSALLLRVRELRLSLQGVAHEIADLSQGRLGDLRIGTGPIPAEQQLPGALSTMLKDAPRVMLNISISDNDLMIPALRKGELDLIVNYLPKYSTEGMVREHLHDDTFVVFASADHRLTKLKRVTLADLAQERWALSEPTLLYREWLSRKFEDSGFPPLRVALQTRSVRLRLQTLVSSDLLDFTSRHAFHEAAQRYGLKELPVKELQWTRQIGVIYRKDPYLSPTVTRFIEILKTAAKEIAAKNK